MSLKILKALATASLLLSVAQADEATLAQTPSNASSAELSRAVENMDEAQVRDAGLAQAEQIRHIPDEMAAQGTPVSPAVQAKFNRAADELAADANQPGFKDRVLDALKVSESGLVRAGVDIGEGLGYAGSVVVSVSMAPFFFGSDFFSSLVSGHGVITDGGQNNLIEVTGYTGGMATFYYTYVGLKALGYTAATPVLASGLGVVLVNELVCLRLADEGGTTELDQYCSNNTKLLHEIADASARYGDDAGSFLHKPLMKACDGIVDAYHWIIRLFRRGSEMGSLTPCEPVPSPSPSQSPSA
jgi:hypothetical protein